MKTYIRVLTTFITIKHADTETIFSFFSESEKDQLVISMIPQMDG